MSLVDPNEPRRTLEAAAVALRRWSARQHLAAAAFSVAFALLIGIPSVLIPNPVFGREVPVVAWNYPVWIASSILAGMLAATYVRARTHGGSAPGSPVGSPSGISTGSSPRAATGGLPGTPNTGDAREGDAPSRFGALGTVLAWFAVGCPVCNKLALLALGYSGALRWFAPAQPYLAAVALAVTAGALLVRLRGQVLCPTRVPGPAPAQLSR